MATRTKHKDRMDWWCRVFHRARHRRATHKRKEWTQEVMACGKCGAWRALGGRIRRDAEPEVVTEAAKGA